MESSNVRTIREKSKRDAGKKEEANGYQAEHCYQHGEQQFFEDRAKLTKILPEEVWGIIFKKLKGNTQENFINSSLVLRDVANNDRALCLFPKVVGIMAPMFEGRKFKLEISTRDEKYLKNIWDRDTNELKRKQTIASAKLWRSTVFNCRLVCFYWNKAVEKCYERPEMAGIKKLSMDLDPLSHKNMMHIELFKEKFTFRKYKRITERFTKYFQESHSSGQTKNPFFGRSVFIDMQFEMRPNGQHYIALKKMLELFGDEIWYCELIVPPNYVGRILNLMPNLKFLKLKSTYYWPQGMNYVPKELPNLKNLRVLSLIFFGSPLITKLILRNSHVEYLSFKGCEVDDNVGSFLANLKGYSTDKDMTYDKVSTRFGNNWKLKSVKNSNWAIRYLRTKELFSLLENNWAETLTDVTLKCPFGRNADTVYELSKNNRLNLPCVCRFSVESNYVFFLDFLEPMQKNLEYLTICHTDFYDEVKHFEKGKSEQKIEWVGFKRKMNDSNIWKLFENLKTVRIKLSTSGPELIFTKISGRFLH